jgi:stage II sporulation protein AA (anti-sigma F factor antagonist)
MTTDGSDQFRIDEARREDAIVLTLHGELDLASADALERRLGELRDAGTPTHLNLDELGFMDSSGLRLVLKAVETGRAAGWAFTLTEGSEQVRQLFTSAGVTGRLPFAT